MRSCSTFVRSVALGACSTSFACALASSSCRSAPPAAAGATENPKASVHDSGSDAVGSGEVAAHLSAAPEASDGGRDAEAGVAWGNPMQSHRETRDDLLSLFTIKDLTEAQKKAVLPDAFLLRAFGTDGPGRMSQGNKAIAEHAISREQCLAGLKDIVLQTPEQRAICGAENMVPAWLKGQKPWFCIDIFEFPNRPCELPMVWTPPTWAKKVCELQGKRLCAQTEWNIACRGDPEGGDDTRYAYGNQLDLDACNTNKGHRQACVVRDAKTAWQTCATDTEPSGAFPRCRSRFGVFDQHGNVAEVMMRRDSEGTVVTQLKGSAWFYRGLAKEPDQPAPESTPNKSGAYPDHCNFDPRWHVENLEGAWHVNYHLGFRCCKGIP